MPTLTRFFVKTSLVYLVAALLVGFLLAAPSALPLPAAVTVLAPTYFHLLMVGWMAQLIFGIVYWMFPKYTRERPHGNETLAWAVYVLLNAGLLLRVVGEPLHTLVGGYTGWLLAFSAFLQWLAGLGFVANTWPRVKER